MTLTTVLAASPSVLLRENVAGIISTEPSMALLGTTASGAATIAAVRRLRPMVVLLDARLHDNDASETTREIMTEVPTPIVILSDESDSDEVEMSLHALRVGALAVTPKPQVPGSAGFDVAARHLIDNAKAMAGVRLVRRWPERPKPTRLRTGRSGRAIAVAASTGGPAALQQVFGAMAADFPAPILVVQHIAPGFVDGLISWLGGTGGLRVKKAVENEFLQPGTVYVAADGRHLGISMDGRVVLSADPAIGGFRPSATFLFESVGRVFGSGAVGVILTGMGRDGVEGLRALRGCGGHVVAQDEKTSVVFGMPCAAIDAGVVNAVLPLPEIAAHLVRAVEQ